jgi:hypothetical protein
VLDTRVSEADALRPALRTVALDDFKVVIDSLGPAAAVVITVTARREPAASGPVQFAEPNSSESHDSRGVTRCSPAPTRVEAEPGASGPGVGTDGSSVKGISLSVPRS